jgi:hypothetical protein
LELIVKVVQDDNFPSSAKELRRHWRRSLRLPIALNLKSVLPTSELEERRRVERVKSEFMGFSGYYGEWVRVYRATAVAPPPEMHKTKSLDFKAGGGDDKTNYNHFAVIAIDDGYRAVQGWVAALKNIWKDDYSVDLALGNRTHRLNGGNWVWVTALMSAIPYRSPWILSVFPRSP